MEAPIAMDFQHGRAHLSSAVSGCRRDSGFRSYWVGDTWLWYDPPPAGVCSNHLRLGHGYVQYVWWDVSRYSGLNRIAGYYRDDPANLETGWMARSAKRI